MSRSPGVRPFVATLLLAGSLAHAEQVPRSDTGFDTAREAIAAQAWQAAAAIWRREAENGNAEAWMGLGNLWDLGVLGRRDQAAALGFYRKAAEAGLPAAAFNVGAMHATGSGTQRDLVAAARWYALAAFRGHERAAFALGRLYAEGAALPRNARIAASWLNQASSAIPASEDSLSALNPLETGTLNAPVPLAFQLIEQDGQVHAHAAWSAHPGPEGSVFRVEIRDADRYGRSATVVGRVDTRDGSAAMPMPDDVRTPTWRVLMIDEAGADYAASEWTDTLLRPVAATGANLVRFQTEAGNDRARMTAETVADGLLGTGLRVTFGALTEPLAASSVRYRFAADAQLARDVAEFLPALDAGNVARDPTLDTLPGEVVVLLAVVGQKPERQSDK